MESKDFTLNINENMIKGKIFFPKGNYNQALGLIILCHGIPGSVIKDPDDPGYPKLAESLTKDGYQAVIFNFRGAGESTGDFDILGWVEDLKGVINYITALNNFSLQPIVFGFSAGAAIAVYTAAHDNKIHSLILCGCPADFDSIISDTGIEQFLQHTREVGIIKTSGFPPDQSKWEEGFKIIRPEKWISQIKSIPKLILHGDNDDVVPVDHAYRLFNKAQEPKDLLIVKKGGHRLRLNEEAMRAALEWIKKTKS